MNKHEAERLSRRVERESRTVRVTGLRFWGRGSYELDAVDTMTGYPFVIRSAEDWNERHATALSYQQEAY